MPASSPEPAVSIILPTYNRARFLPQAFASIRAQTWTDWELIIVDDGSTDNTRDLTAKFAAAVAQSVCYVYQANQGAYSARNTGLDHARGRHIAFYDSDDVWLPHHLQDCVVALERNPDVDWVYGASRVVEFGTGRVVDPNTFYVDGTPRPFLRLHNRTSDLLRIIDDPDVIRCMLLEGLYSGLQNSVIQRRVFEGRRFQGAYRNEAEDQVIVVRALAAGQRLAYLDNVHVVYHQHDHNSSAAGSDRNLEKHLQIYRALVRGFEELRCQLRLRPTDERALRRRLSREYFWHLGYSLLWEHGRRREALAMFHKGLGYWPWSVSCWKTYVLVLLRSGVGTVASVLRSVAIIK